jgi:hypothetical protein
MLMLSVVMGAIAWAADVSVVIVVDSEMIYAANCLRALQQIDLLSRVADVTLAPIGSRSTIQREFLTLSVAQFNDAAKRPVRATIVERNESETAFSQVVNAAVRSGAGRLVLFMHDSVEVAPSVQLGEWIARLDGLSTVGAIGAPLTLPDRRTVYDNGVEFALEAMQQETETNWWDQQAKQNARNTALPHVSP